MLITLAMLLNKRAQLIYQTLLGNTHIVQGTPPTPSLQSYAYQFTPLGIIVAGWLVIKYGKGAFGLAVVYLLAALLTVVMLTQYKNILPLFVKKGVA